MSKQSYSVLIAATRPTPLYGALISLANQTIRPAAIIVKDNAPISITTSYEFRFMSDMLRYEGIEVECFRTIDRRELGPSRNDLVDHTQTEVCVFMDDDCFWQYDVAEHLLRGLETYKMVVGLQLTSSYETGLGNDYSPPSPPNVHEQFTFQTYPFTKETEIARGCTIMFQKKDYTTNVRNEMEGWWQGVGLDDVALCLHLRPVGIVQSAKIWHLLSPTSRTIPLLGHNRMEERFTQDLKEKMRGDHVRN